MSKLSYADKAKANKASATAANPPAPAPAPAKVAVPAPAPVQPSPVRKLEPSGAHTPSKSIVDEETRSNTLTPPHQRAFIKDWSEDVPSPLVEAKAQNHIAIPPAALPPAVLPIPAASKVASPQTSPAGVLGQQSTHTVPHTGGSFHSTKTSYAEQARKVVLPSSIANANHTIKFTAEPYVPTPTPSPVKVQQQPAAHASPTRHVDPTPVVVAPPVAAPIPTVDTTTAKSPQKGSAVGPVHSSPQRTHTSTTQAVAPAQSLTASPPRVRPDVVVPPNEKNTQAGSGLQLGREIEIQTDDQPAAPKPPKNNLLSSNPSPSTHHYQQPPVYNTSQETGGGLWADDTDFNGNNWNNGGNYNKRQQQQTNLPPIPSTAPALRQPQGGNMGAVGNRGMMGAPPPAPPPTHQQAPPPHGFAGSRYIPQQSPPMPPPPSQGGWGAASSAYGSYYGLPQQMPPAPPQTRYYQPQSNPPKPRGGYYEGYN
eukprot:PhF_6_TR26129/c0_g1_i1/m.36993